MEGSTLEYFLRPIDLMDGWNRNSDNTNCKGEVGERYLELCSDFLDPRHLLMASGYRCSGGDVR